MGGGQNSTNVIISSFLFNFWPHSEKNTIGNRARTGYFGNLIAKKWPLLQLAVVGGMAPPPPKSAPVADMAVFRMISPKTVTFLALKYPHDSRDLNR